MATTPAIPNTDRIVSYSPVGLTSAFVVPWPVIADSEILAEDDLVVLVNGSQINSSLFTFAGNVVAGLSGIWNGGTVTLATAVSNSRVIIYSRRDPRRTGFFLEGQSLPFTTLDKLTDDIIVQLRDLALRVARSIKVSVTDYLDNGEPNVTFTAGTLSAAVAAFLAGASPVATIAGWAVNLATAKALYGAPTVLANGHLVAVQCRAAIADGYGGLFSYDSADGATVFASDGLGFVDNQNRRFKRIYPAGSILAGWFNTTLTDADAAAVALAADLVLDKNFTLTGNTVLSAKTIRRAGGLITRGAFTLSGNFEGSIAQFVETEIAGRGLVTFPRVPLFFMPTMWGAANDGVTDDYYAIQAAITAAQNHGGEVIIRGSYLTTQQLLATTTSTQKINYAINGYGGRIITRGAISGLQIGAFNNSQGPRVNGLTIDQYSSPDALPTAGFDCKGAIGALLRDCMVITSTVALGANRSTYYAYRMRANGAFGSYWCVLEDCMNAVPDAANAALYIKAGLLVEDDCNSAKVIRLRTNGTEAGIRMIAASTNGAAGTGQPNCFVVQDLAAEAFSNAAFYVLHSSADPVDKYLFGLKIDGIRSEPANGGTYAWKVETTGAGAWTDTARVPRVRNIEDIGGARILVPGGMTYVET